MGNDTAAISGLIAESILFATFLGVCTGLLKRRFSVKKTALLACVFAEFILFLNIEVFLNSQELQVAVGYEAAGEGEDAINDLINRADLKMYENKRKQREI